MNNTDVFQKIVVDLILGTPKAVLSRVEKLESKDITSSQELITLLGKLDAPIISEDQIKEFAGKMPINGDSYYCMNTKKLIRQTAEVLNNILIFVGDPVDFSEFEEVQMIIDFMIRFMRRLERYNQGHKLDFRLAEGFVIGYRFAN